MCASLTFYMCFPIILKWDFSKCATPLHLWRLEVDVKYLFHLPHSKTFAIFPIQWKPFWIRVSRNFQRWKEIGKYLNLYFWNNFAMEGCEASEWVSNRQIRQTWSWSNSHSKPPAVSFGATIRRMVALHMMWSHKIWAALDLGGIFFFGRLFDFFNFLAGQGESGWCSDMTSTHGAWRHAGVRFLLPGAHSMNHCSCKWIQLRDIVNVGCKNFSTCDSPDVHKQSKCCFAGWGLGKELVVPESEIIFLKNYSQMRCWRKTMQGAPNAPNRKVKSMMKKRFQTFGAAQQFHYACPMHKKAAM